MLALLWRVWIAFRVALLGLFLITVVLLAAWLGYRFPIGSGRAAETSEKKESGTESITRLDEDTLVIPAGIAQRMGLRFAPVALNTQARTLPPFPGCLAQDPNKLARVRSRFAGEVTELGTIDDPTAPGGKRPLGVGDVVKKNQLMAVVTSKDLGEKKSDYLDAVSKREVSRDVLQKTLKQSESGLLPERNLRDAQRALDSDQIAVDRARRTLVAWKISKTELDGLEAEGKAWASKRDTNKPRLSDGKDWARVEVLAPQGGEILEKALNYGDQVDTTTDLYKIGDRANMQVWVHVFEEDLPLLQALPKPIPCSIQVANNPSPLLGSIERVGAVIDAAQHTALVVGKVLNPDRTLLINQNVTVTVELPNEKGDIEVPTAAVVENGKESVVFVRSPDRPDEVIRRPVHVQYRTQEKITLRSRTDGVQVGEQVVASGALLLREVMETTPPPAIVVTRKE